MRRLATLFAFITLVLMLPPRGAGQYHFNQAMSFDGVDDFIYADYTDFDTLKAITIEAWINIPAYPASGSFGCIYGKNYSLSTALFVASNGTLLFHPVGGTAHLYGNHVIPLNVWTHIAATYDGSHTSLYINGTVDSTTAIAGPIGSDSDSLFIGADRQGGLPAYFFKGMIDQINIWGRARSQSDIQRDMYIPNAVSSPSGTYAGLVASYRLDGYNFVYSEGGRGAMPAFRTGGPANVDLRQKGIDHLDYNGNLVLNGNGYCAAPPTALGEATTAVTLEAWVRPDSSGTATIAQNIVNRSSPTDRYSYALYLMRSGGSYGLDFELNAGYAGAVFLATKYIIRPGVWTHIAGSYSSSTGRAIVTVNGNAVIDSIIAAKPTITVDFDSTYIGGIGCPGYRANVFKGQIDEVRIWKDVARSAAQIRSTMFKSIDVFSTDITDQVMVWGFDGMNYDTRTNLITGYPRVPMQFNGQARMSSAHKNINTELTSPLLRDDAGHYADPLYYAIRAPFVNITEGVTIRDSVYFANPGVVSNPKVFLLMNHTWISDVFVYLRAPDGTRIALLSRAGSNGNDAMTILSDAADSTIGYPGHGLAAPFSPFVRPANSLSEFNGHNQQGWWLLEVEDPVIGSTGSLTAWGIATGTTTDIAESPAMPETWELGQNWPNPFNPVTQINYTIGQGEGVSGRGGEGGRNVSVQLVVYDILGRQVTVLVNERQAPGSYRVRFDGTGLASGVYFYRLESGSFVDVKKMILVK